MICKVKTAFSFFLLTIAVIYSYRFPDKNNTQHIPKGANICMTKLPVTSDDLFTFSFRF